MKDMANSTNSIEDSFLHTSDTTHRIVESTIMCIIFAIGAVGNPITAWIVVRNKKLHNLHNSLTMNIIFVDSLATFTIMPMQLYVFVKGRWPFAVNICELMGFLIIVFSTCALWTILWLSVLRILHIHKPSAYSAIIRPQCIITITASTWVVALLAGSTLLGLEKIKFKAKFSVCFFLFDSIAEMTLFMLPFVVIPIVFVSVLSILIFRSVRKPSNHTRSNQRQLDNGLAYTYLMLVFIYNVCYFPIFIIETESLLFKDQQLPHSIHMMVTFLGFLPFSLKTVAYMLMKKSTRETLLGFFKKTNAVTFAKRNQIIPLGEVNGPKNKAEHGQMEEKDETTEMAAV